MKPTFVFTLLALVLAFTLIPRAQAQRVVKIGGGLAEMQAIYFEQNLATYVQACLPDGACGLQAAERASLQELLRADSAERAQVPIEFVTDSLGELPFTTERRLGAAIRIQSTALYQADGSPKPFAFDAAIVLAGRLAHVDSTTPLTDLYKLAQMIFIGLQVQSQTYRLLAVPGLLQVHDLNFTYGDRTQQSLFIEDGAKTTDLTSMVSAVLPCGELKGWKFNSWRGVGGTRDANFLAQARGSCDPTQSYILSVSMLLDGQSQVEPQTLRARMKIGC